jgi:hypothetical protein
LGDGVKTGAGAEGNGGSIRVSSVGGVGISSMGGIGISSIGGIRVSCIVGIGISVSGPLAKIVCGSRDSNSLGHRVKSLSDGVKTGAGAEGNGGSIRVSSVGGVGISSMGGIGISSIGGIRVSCIVGIGISVSGPLAKIVCGSRDSNSLGHRVKSLSDGV